jgi:hypothetical protein
VTSSYNERYGTDQVGVPRDGGEDTPMIQLTAPAGSLSEPGRAGIQRTLATTLLRWEGAPDTAFFRSLAWSYLHELPPGVVVTAEDDEPRFRVDVTVPEGALSIHPTPKPRGLKVVLSGKSTRNNLESGRVGQG